MILFSTSRLSRRTLNLAGSQRILRTTTRDLFFLIQLVPVLPSIGVSK
ncbi:hypothetical protein Krac_7083 [Ktedonobacter racemifer DSM 44963]|uniref:Uncharacterized protein n=1 Tax=Ktedonobacter racemifer DSM 44963 TaxID=485913 RepID=D6TQW5_KTERA|nr:hypothetical protein Krac_7083 [Ktedonobacter racemifer DSM 44963]